MKKSLLPTLAALSLALGACSGTDDSPVIIDQAPVVIPPPLTDWHPAPLKSVSEGNTGKANGFAIDLFKKTMESGEDNLCLSPVSVFASLAMAANGDSGATRDEILSLLGYGADDITSLNLFCNALLTETTILNGGTECAYANSFWYRPSLLPCESFLSAVHTIYDTDIFNTWLGDDHGMQMVNEYIAANTRGLIPQFLSAPLEEDMALVNTTYFKGSWKVKFDKEKTVTRTFHNLDGTTSKTAFMHRYDEMECARTPSLLSVRLPYVGDRYTMTLIMPTEDRDFDSMLAELSPATLETLDQWYRSGGAPLYLPRFETSVNIDLLDQLKDMGLDLGCHRGFDSICLDESYVITVVKHGVKLIVDEEGTEAAGVTLTGMLNTANQDLSFDRPFVYLIRDTISDTILFIGAVTKF